MTGRRSSPRGVSRRTATGAVLLGLGALLMATVAAYYVYGAVAGSRVGELSYVESRPAGPARVAALDAPAEPKTPVVASDSPPPAPPSVVTVERRAAEPPAPARSAVPSSAPEVLVQAVAAVEREVPRTAPLGIVGFLTPDRSTDDDGGAAVQISPQTVEKTVMETGASEPGPDSLAVSLLPAQMAGLRTEPAYGGTGILDPLRPPLSASRIQIPVIDVDSRITDLNAVLEDDSYVWETPYRTVGHIPTTAVPGGDGEGWYFGHLESPIRGEGNVFQRLPEIPGLLREGETVQITLESGDWKYVYQVYMTQVVPQSELTLTDSRHSDITLVTCYPRFHYDKRLMVTAALIGVTES